MLSSSEARTGHPPFPEEVPGGATHSDVDVIACLDQRLIAAAGVSHRACGRRRTVAPRNEGRAVIKWLSGSRSLFKMSMERGPGLER